MIKVTFTGLERARLNIVGLGKDLDPNRREVRTLFAQLGRGGRNVVQRQITTQGFGTWAPLSNWTKARTGRRKALTTERGRVTFRVKPRRAEVVYAERSSEWNLTKHHKGFTTPGVKDKLVTVTLRNPSAIKWNRPAISFRNSKDSVVPPRSVWGTLAQHVSVAREETTKWIVRVINKRARR